MLKKAVDNKDRRKLTSIISTFLILSLLIFKPISEQDCHKVWLILQ